MVALSNQRYSALSGPDRQALVGAVPEVLRRERRWVVWRAEERDGKPTKVPYQPKNPDRHARVNGPATWATFEEALAALERDPTLAGLGFVLGDGFVGLDLDGCLTSEVPEPVQRLIEALGGYAEISPSGRGVHIIVRASKLPKGPSRLRVPWAKGVEIYADNRFFTVTSRVLHAGSLEEDASERLATVVYQLQLENLVERAPEAKRAKLRLLVEGLWEEAGYPSQSEADLALAGELLRYTRGDRAWADRLFRASGLARSKWDERHASDGRTYGELTFDRAAQNARGLETPQTNPSSSLTPEAFPEGLMLGLARDFAELYSQAVESPKSFLFCSFLTCLGALVGDRVALKAVTRNPARLYTVLLGPSGLARKSTAIRLTVNFFQRAVEDFPVVRGIGSAEGLAKIIEKRGYTNCLLVFDELRAFVDKAKIEGSVLLSLVNALFEESYAENHTKASHIELENVHLSVLSACTPDTFALLFNRHFIAIGFPNRLFLVLGETKERKPVPKEVDREAELELIQRLGGVLARTQSYSPENPLLLELTPEAEALWAEFYHALPNTVSAVRLDQIGLRLAMLLAVSLSREVIDREIAEAVIEICRWELRVREELMPVEAENAIAQLEERIRRALRSRGPLRDRDLKRVVNAHRSGLWLYEAAKRNLLRAREIRFDPRIRVFTLVDEDSGVSSGLSSPTEMRGSFSSTAKIQHADKGSGL